MTTISIPLEEAESRLEELLSRVEKGADIVITRDGKPSVKLVPVAQEIVSTRGQRRFGQHRGPVVMSEDFDEPLPDAFWLGKES